MTPLTPDRVADPGISPVETSAPAFLKPDIAAAGPTTLGTPDRDTPGISHPDFPTPGISAGDVPPSATGLDHPAATATTWRALVTPYLEPSWRKAVVQLATTALPFLAVMAGLLIALDHRFLPGLLLLPAGALLLVRLFIIQHDCGHGSFFASAWANGLLGRALSLLTLTPYTFWRRDHAMHHAGTGNLDRRGAGDVTTLTLAEYRALPLPRRVAYRLYRHPAVMFGVGPAWLILLRLRIPSGNPLRRWRDWVSIVGTDAALAGLVAVLILVLGPLPVLLGWLPVMLLAATIGVWLFYIQHQFEAAYWEPRPQWDFHAAALQGSSFYDLPRVLHWMTGNIGFHHIHHLASRIPNYRLRECHEANPVFHAAPRLTLRASIRCAGLALWDPEHRKLVPFKAAGED